jgi:ribulose-phosphate 3-epimerase
MSQGIRLPRGRPGTQVQIAASILAADFTRLGEQIAEAERGGAAAIHADVMDGRFVPPITMGPVVVAAVRRATRLPIDVHLMVVEPDRQLDDCIRAGATSITVHVEAATHLHRIIEQLKGRGVRAGVALNPATPAGAIEPVLGELDIVLVMSVNPGYAGQRFIPSVLPKIQQLRSWITDRDLSLDVGVDGGITTETLPLAAAAGANVFVAASAIFSGPERIEASLKRLLGAAQLRA